MPATTREPTELWTAAAVGTEDGLVIVPEGGIGVRVPDGLLPGAVVVGRPELPPPPPLPPPLPPPRLVGAVPFPEGAGPPPVPPPPPVPVGLDGPAVLVIVPLPDDRGGGPIGYVGLGTYPVPVPVPEA